MKFIKLTTTDGVAIRVASEEISLLTPSKKEGAKTAIYETFDDFIEDSNYGIESNPQDHALHVRESMDFIDDSANALYRNKIKTFHPAT